MLSDAGFGSNSGLLIILKRSIPIGVINKRKLDRYRDIALPAVCYVEFFKLLAPCFSFLGRLRHVIPIHGAAPLQSVMSPTPY